MADDLDLHAQMNLEWDTFIQQFIEKYSSLFHDEQKSKPMLYLDFCCALTAIMHGIAYDGMRELPPRIYLKSTREELLVNTGKAEWPPQEG